MSPPRKSAARKRPTKRKPPAPPSPPPRPAWLDYIDPLLRVLVLVSGLVFAYMMVTANVGKGKEAQSELVYLSIVFVAFGLGLTVDWLRRFRRNGD